MIEMLLCIVWANPMMARVLVELSDRSLCWGLPVPNLRLEDVY